jgi:hypothetical protein
MFTLLARVNLTVFEWVMQVSEQRDILFFFMLHKSMCNFNRVVEIWFGACLYYCQQRSLEILPQKDELNPML